MIKRDDRGFILLEAIIAIAVLGIMFGGAIMLYSRSIVGLRHAGDQLVATYLAQDALEVIIAKYQYNGSRFRPFMEDIDVDTCTDCQVDTTVRDVTGTVITACVDGCRLKLDGGRYVHGGGGDLSPYTRTVTATQTGNRGDVEVRVLWKDGTRDRVYTLTYTLYDYDFDN